MSHHSKEDLALLHIRKNMQLPNMMVRKAIKAGSGGRLVVADEESMGSTLG